MENIPKTLGVLVLIFVAVWLAAVVALFIAGFTALTVFGIIKSNYWALIGGAAYYFVFYCLRRPVRTVLILLIRYNDPAEA